MSTPQSLAEPDSSPFAYRGFALYWWARFLTVFAIQIISVAVGWHIYDLTRDPLYLGLVGLVQFAPSLALVLVTGTVADRFNRRRIMTVCLAIEALCAAALLAMIANGFTVVWPIFVTLFVFGVARAFIAPAIQSLAANLVPKNAFASAIAWNSSAFQIGSIVGPVVGGLAYGISAVMPFILALSLFATATLLTLLIAKPPQKTVPEPATWTTVFAGFRFIWNKPIVLGAISLDLFAVLLGGATALLPAYARDVLEVGPWGLGLLRSATGIGALLTAIWLARHPIRDHAGATMFAAVAIFGVFTIVFGLSTIVWLSVIALAIMGAVDMVSVYIRQTFVQLATPDEVRGRVNAVNMLFIGASNELGEFRAGAMAALIGVVPAVVFGGAGTLVVALLWALWFPDLRTARKLDGR